MQRCKENGRRIETPEQRPLSSPSSVVKDIDIRSVQLSTVQYYLTFLLPYLHLHQTPFTNNIISGHPKVSKSCKFVPVLTIGLVTTAVVHILDRRDTATLALIYTSL